MRDLRPAAARLACVVMCATAIWAQAPAPAYRVHDNVLRRSSGGGYTVEVAAGLKYLGVQRFYIRNVADAEQHLFASYDSKGNVQRLVWVQIESQLPKQDWQYNYRSPERTKLGSLEFITDSAVSRSYVAYDPSSDHAVMDRQLALHHLRLSGPVMRLRMIHLPDPERRRELMVIYARPLPGVDTESIPEDGVDASRWPRELKNLKAMAVRDVKVSIAK